MVVNQTPERKKLNKQQAPLKRRDVGVTTARDGVSKIVSCCYCGVERMLNERARGKNASIGTMIRLTPSIQGRRRLATVISTDATSELHIFRHDGDTLGMNRTEIRVFKESNEEVLRGFLESKDRRGLETNVGRRTVLGDFSEQTLEGRLAQEQFGALLVLANLSESNCSGTVALEVL